MLRVIQKINGVDQNVNISGPLTKILKFMRGAGIPAFAIYDLTKHRSCRFYAGESLIEIDIEEIAQINEQTGDVVTQGSKTEGDTLTHGKT